MISESKAVFAGGCFWCTEAVFTRLKGVLSVKSGYTGGKAPNPTYEQVCTGDTGHAEAIQITFNSGEITYQDLLNVFFATHDPTTLNQQGNDFGTQYRSAIFFTDEQQKLIAEKYIHDLESQNIFDAKIVTEINPLHEFYPAESYHDNYYNLNSNKPYCSVVISPKINKLRSKFAPLLKQE